MTVNDFLATKKIAGKSLEKAVEDGDISIISNAIFQHNAEGTCSLALEDGVITILSSNTYGRAKYACFIFRRYIGLPEAIVGGPEAEAVFKAVEKRIIVNKELTKAAEKRAATARLIRLNRQNRAE